MPLIRNYSLSLQSNKLKHYLMDENAEQISLELIAGDRQAFDTVYKQYYRGLCAFASQYVTVPESEEIVQDVMMWLWKTENP